MKAVRVAIPLVLIGLLVCCLAASQIKIDSEGIMAINRESEGHKSGSGSGSDGSSPPPGRGSCAGIGVDYPDNPFRGWPVPRFIGDWKVISSWFCDPNYFRGYTHWGIDLAVRVTATEWQSLDNADVVSTTDRAVVIAALADGGFNFGMGNHVKILHVVCSERCGQANEEGAEYQYIYLLDANARQCIPPTPTPDPYWGDPDLTPPSRNPDTDLLLDCRWDGWKATYMHLRSVSVEKGQMVNRGDVLGQIDSTGNSTGTHLHYQINGPEVGAIDPAPAMCRDYYDGLRSGFRWTLPVCQNLGGPEDYQPPTDRE